MLWAPVAFLRDDPLIGLVSRPPSSLARIAGLSRHRPRTSLKRRLASVQIEAELSIGVKAEVDAGVSTGEQVRGVARALRRMSRTAAPSWVYSLHDPEVNLYRTGMSYLSPTPPLPLFPEFFSCLSFQMHPKMIIPSPLNK